MTDRNARLRIPRLLAALALTYAACAPGPARADDHPRLRFPVACNLHVDCWFMALPDADGDTDKARDYECGGQTAEGQSGTLIALSDRTAMEKGVEVVAAQAGTLERLRDGEDDRLRAPDDLKAVAAGPRACGNGLIVQHEGGWSTQYCHLAKNSFQVKQGDRVKAGQALGRIGLSGATSHPHLQFYVRHKGEERDPFSGRKPGTGCGGKPNPLWGERVTSDSYGLYDAGFAPDTPDFSLISQGLKPPLPTDASPKVLFWFAYFNARAGDRITLSLSDQDGRTLAEETMVQSDDRPRQFYYTGRVIQTARDLSGTYRGVARVTRISAQGDTRTQSIERSFRID